MIQFEIKNKTLRKYIFFSNVSPQIKNPLTISLFIHGLLLLTGLFMTQNDRLVNEFTVEIINTPTEMSVKNYNRLNSVEDQSKKINETRIRKNLLQADPGSLINHHKNENNADVSTQDETFVNKYEDVLFNRKNTNTADNRTVKENQNKLKWDQSGAQVSHSDKTAVAEKIPAGRGVSKNINWKTGYSRKLIFQPDIEYPEYFRKQGIQASVRLIIDVDASGNVVNADVLQSSGYSKLDILARKGVLKAKFLKRENINNVFDRGEVEVQYKLE